MGMVKIENIKQNIIQLDAGSFQNLCDSYLYKVGYPNIVSLGGKAGTRKTTVGTPDTYFNTSDDRYIFIEYTTQVSGLFPKMKDDIDKCLDISKTGITHDKIAEIIYCHTSSNITPAQDNEIKTLCNDAGIKLTIIGIDKLAEDIYLQYHILARDFLGISISTNQIQSYDDFIRDYNSNRMAAPIDTKFLFRDKEIEDINKAYQEVDIVILSGMAGTGKTRLALHYAKMYSNIHSKKLYCIHSNALPIYEDLKLFIDKPGNYLLFIDDANQLSGLQHIIRYTTMKDQGYNVKILITTRDYALKKVENDIQKINSYTNVNIKAFTDEQIKELLETTLGIVNQDYQERIIRIAEGNARIAILAGRVACNSNRLDSINDVSQLYENYYGTSLEEYELLTNNSMCITAGIIAFLEAIHLEHIDPLLPILQEKGLCRSSFIENISKLHEQEIVDIYNDKAVRFSEQSLSNYLLKYVFFDKKLISLSLMIKSCFQSYKKRTISSISTLLNIFRNEDLFYFVEDEIKKVWDDLLQDKSPYFFEFVKVFSKINTTETLLILQEKVELEENIIIKVSDTDFEKGKNYQSVTDDIIEVLCGFADMTDLPAALDLLFQYYLKRPDLYMQFYHAISKYFGIRKNSIYYEYYTQITLLEKMKEYSHGWKQEFVTVLFLEVAKEFLKLHFTPIEGGRKNTLTMYQIPLAMSEGVEEYRKLIWESLYTLCKDDKYKEKVREVIDSYGGAIDAISIPVLEYDLTYISAILESRFPPSELKNCLLADKITRTFSIMGIATESLFVEYFKSRDFLIYKLLKGPDYEDVTDYNEIEKMKRQSIEQFLSDYDSVKFKQFIDVCYKINGFDGGMGWEVSGGLNIAFDAISTKKKSYVDAIEYYIIRDTPLNLNPERLVNILFSLLSDSEVFDLINNNLYNQKNAWLYAYYHELPLDLITKEHIKRLYEYLGDASDRNITSSSIRNIDFLEKYSLVDEDVLLNASKIILEKVEYSPFMVNIYFSLLFNHLHNEPREVINKFEKNLELLEEIYCFMLLYNKHHDYNGKFLNAIYSVQPSLLKRYIDYLVNKDKGSFSNQLERNKCFFELDDFIEIYNRIVEQLINDYQFPTIFASHFLESILLPVKDGKELLKKQDRWIRQYIELFSSDEIKMKCLFSVIAKLKVDRKKDYISLFLENNQIFEDFKKIPLIPTSWSWTGSAIPMYSHWIEFLESLLPQFVGLKWIKHKDHIEKKISYLKKRIESEQIQEILEG